MNGKTQRLLAIRKIISTSKIGTQDELLVQLAEKGYNLTQATLSRDLKLLKVGKIADPGKGYIYFLPDANETIETKILSLKDNFTVNGVLSLKFSNNLGVIKTRSGFASSVASFIDSKSPFEILATIAGDDTILIVPAEGIKPLDIKNAIILIMPELEGKI